MALRATDQLKVLATFATEYEDILESSAQAIYIYLDDTHKVCNEAFATLLGYDSPAEWAAVDATFPTVFVAVDSQHALVHAYRAAMERAVASSIEVTWKTTTGDTVRTRVILAPIEHGGLRAAIHFVTEH